MSLQNSASPSPSQGEPDRGAHFQPRSDMAAKKSFSQVPHEIYHDERLKFIDSALIGILLQFARQSSVAWPSVETLAKLLRRSVRTIQYSLRRLIDTEWIAIRPADNPTGRVIVLVWREKRREFVNSIPYTQGLPRPNPVPAPPPVQKKVASNPPPTQSVAPEVNKQGIEQEGSALASKSEREKPMTHAELFIQYTETGWLSRPPNHPLRQLAERTLARSLEKASNLPSNVVDIELTPTFRPPLK